MYGSNNIMLKKCREQRSKLPNTFPRQPRKGFQKYTEYQLMKCNPKARQALQLENQQEVADLIWKWLIHLQQTSRMKGCSHHQKSNSQTRSLSPPLQLLNRITQFLKETTLWVNVTTWCDVGLQNKALITSLRASWMNGFSLHWKTSLEIGSIYPPLLLPCKTTQS